MGAELSSGGIDITYAPVLDVDSNPANPVTGDRAFGHDAPTVTAVAIALIHGLWEGAILPCGKHFPGHGDTNRDSHSRDNLCRRRSPRIAT
jgi:beta-N-acetylhexosaminidase